MLSSYIKYHKKYNKFYTKNWCNLSVVIVDDLLLPHSWTACYLVCKYESTKKMWCY
jgi:hypothetical protein